MTSKMVDTSNELHTYLIYERADGFMGKLVDRFGETIIHEGEKVEGLAFTYDANATEKVTQKVFNGLKNELAEPKEDERETLYIDLGNIGNHAQKFQKLFPEYYTEPFEVGTDVSYFLRFENTSYIGNKGVQAITNAFDSKEHFMERLNLKLLYNFVDK